MGGNDTISVADVYNASEDEDSYGPPVLSPQIEFIHDDKISDYQFEKEVELLWTTRSKNENYLEPTLSVKPIRSHLSKIERSGLASILRKPPKRSSFTFAQYEALFETWEITQFPHLSEVLELVHITGLTVKQVKNWFINRRRRPRGNNNISRNQLWQRHFRGQRRGSASSLNTTNSNSSTGKPLSIDYSSSSERTETAIRYLKLSQKEKREKRLNAINKVQVSTVEECMEANKARLSQLILMYMKKKLDMRRTLLRETTKLKDRITINPFNQRQINAMKKWIDDFFREIYDELSEEKRQKLTYVKDNVIEVWQPIITYGKLSKTSLEIAIDDFSSLNDVDTKSIADTEEFTVPGILRYMESHFN